MQITDSIVNETLENLRRRGFGAYYCATAEEAKELALSLIPSGSAVAWGGSVTAEQIGLTAALKNRADITRIDRDLASSPEEKRELMRKALLADAYVAGVNGISRDGWLVNIDGTGNRRDHFRAGKRNSGGRRE